MVRFDTHVRDGGTVRRWSSVQYEHDCRVVSTEDAFAGEHNTRRHGLL